MAKNTPKRAPKNYAVGDVETDPFKHGRVVRPFCCGFYDGTSPKTWWGPDCIKHLLARCKLYPGIVYFHNLGKFDFHQFFGFADCSLFRDAAMINGRLVSIKYGLCEFRDSFAFVPMGLAGYEKTEMDYATFLPHRREKHRESILSYLADDLKDLRAMLTDAFKLYGFHLTLASAALWIMEHKFGKKIPRLSERDDRWFRRWYFGGRVQFWSLGRHVGRYRIYDINSAFPWAMTKNHWFTAQQWTEGEGGYPKRRRLQSFYLISCAEAGGAIPVRQKNGSVEFPFGPIDKAFITGWELFSGLRTKAIRGVKVAWWWSPSRVSNFGPYVREYFRLKRTAKTSGLRNLYKLILNAFYGKMAINPRVFRDVEIRPYRQPPRDKQGKIDPSWEVVFDDRGRGITVWDRPAKLTSRSFINVAISASITGKVRSYLQEVIAQTRPIYCDTDSVITKKTIPRKRLGSGLGQWKKEAICDVVWIGAKKIYVAHKAQFPWRKRGRKGDVFVKGLGYTERKSFKFALKGARLSIESMIAVCEGRQRTSYQPAESHSLRRERQLEGNFLRRKIRRADKRK